MNELTYFEIVSLRFSDPVPEVSFFFLLLFIVIGSYIISYYVYIPKRSNYFRGTPIKAQCNYIQRMESMSSGIRITRKQLQLKKLARDI